MLDWTELKIKKSEWAVFQKGLCLTKSALLAKDFASRHFKDIIYWSCSFNEMTNLSSLQFWVSGKLRHSTASKQLKRQIILHAFNSSFGDICDMYNTITAPCTAQSSCGFRI